MGFKQPCFIKKNTPELRKKLEDIGHVRYPYEFADWDDDGKDRKYIIIDIMYYTYSTEPIGKPKKKDVDFVDCGNNEELFLALAALRDDSDYMQWFVFPKTQIKRRSGCFGQVIGMDGHYEEIISYDWYKYENKDNALTEKLNTMIQMEMENIEFLPHKATVEELIEHFKTK